MNIDRDEAKDQCHSLFSGFIRQQCLFGAENNLYVNVARKYLHVSPAKNKPQNKDFHFSFE